MDSLKYLCEGTKLLGLDLDSVILSNLTEYMYKLLEFNKYVNLTSITDEKEFIELHILDSLTLLPHISNCKNIIDVGTGGGFPGAVLKIALNSCNVVLLDSSLKKLNFIDNTLKDMGIENYRCVHCRAEQLAHDSKYRQQFDACVSRAVAELSILTELCIPFVKTGGIFIAMKGPSAKHELEVQNSLYKKMGDIAMCSYHMNLPFSNAERILIKYSVEGKIKKDYPRPYSVIKRKPLCNIK